MNKLPLIIKFEKPLSKFRKKLKQFLINNSHYKLEDYFEEEEAQY